MKSLPALVALALAVASPSSAQAACGDGVVDFPFETCDPPGANAGLPNECRADCTFCGDGFRQLAIEGCDDGNILDGDTCGSDCYWPIFVATGGSDATGTGQSWSPYRTIQKAFDSASDFSRIVVAPGTYNECVRAAPPAAGDRPVKILAEAWLEQGDNRATTISGLGVCDRHQPAGRRKPAISLGSRQSRLEGFTITGGGASGVQAVGSVVITHNVIADNWSTSGGGIYFYSAVYSFPGDVQATISHNVIEDNTAEFAIPATGGPALGGDGGGLFVKALGREGDLPTSGNVTVAIEGNVIRRNTIRETSDDAAVRVHGGGLGVFTTTSPGAAVDVQITRNTIEDNGAAPGAQGYSGGAWLYTYGYGTESITFRENTVARNRASLDGGGVSAWVTTFGTRGDSDPRTADTDTHHSIVVEDNVVEDNTTQGNGGGLDLYLFARNLRDPESATVVARGNVITGNHAGGSRGGGGGALATFISWRSPLGDGRVLLENNRITGNTATRSGGGVAILAEADAAPINDPYPQPVFYALANVESDWNLVAGNSVLGENGAGGGIFAFLQAFVDASATARVDRSTVADNRAAIGAGGIHVEAFTGFDGGPRRIAESFLDVENTIVARNDGVGIGGPLPGIGSGVLAPAGGTGRLAVEMLYSDIWSHPAGSTSGWIGDPSGTSGNLSADPLFRQDWMPAGCSPTLDAADPALDAAAEPAPNGGRANMGHTGATPAATLSLADPNGDASVDDDDLSEITAAFGTALGEARYDAAADLNGDGFVDGIDLTFVGDDFGTGCD